MKLKIFEVKLGDLKECFPSGKMSLKSQDANKLEQEVKKVKQEVNTYLNTRRPERARVRKFNIESAASRSRSPKKKRIGPPIFILDNGGYTAKIGMSGDSEPRIIPNCIMKVKSERKRFFIGNQIDDCRDLSGLYYMLPCEKGYITKWNVQKPVWDYLLTNICSAEDKAVIMTQPLFNFKTIQEITDEIFFEEYEIKSMYRVNATDLARYEYVTNVIGREVPCVIVDSGFSFTHIVPYIKGKKYYKACKRINVGGKVLTNYLKDIISYRQLHVMDETYVINQVKEDSCYVSLDFKNDMKKASQYGAKNTIIKNYVLPDFNSIRRGYVQKEGETAEDIAEGCQILRLNNERITVPEILFHPSDIGMESMGVAEAIVAAIKSCPLNEQPRLAKNIVIHGGSVNFPNFRERLYADVRSLLPDHWEVKVYKPDDPISFAWKGGRSLSNDPQLNNLLITKEQYESNGSSYLYEKFSDWLQSEKDDATKANAESNANGPSLLQTSSFSRFDLFGKHEAVAEEVKMDVDDDESSKGSENEKSSTESRNTEVDVVDGENSSSVDVEQNSETVSNRPGRKSATKSADDVTEIVDENVCEESYDFDIFSSYL